jgi:serine/threonine-protein kinase RsbW
VTGGSGSGRAASGRLGQRRPGADEVHLSLPADVGYVATIRLTAAGLAARCDLTVDEIEDLRLAVDEACGLVLAHATAGEALSLHFDLSAGLIAVEVSVPGEREIDTGGLSWIVLSELATSVADVSGSGRVALALSKRRAR